jgi:hypothetical protein
MINKQKLHFLNIGKPLQTKIHDFDEVATMMIWGSKRNRKLAFLFYVLAFNPKTGGYIK